MNVLDTGIARPANLRASGLDGARRKEFQRSARKQDTVVAPKSPSGPVGVFTLWRERVSKDVSDPATTGATDVETDKLWAVVTDEDGSVYGLELTKLRDK